MSALVYDLPPTPEAAGPDPLKEAAQQGADTVLKDADSIVRAAEGGDGGAPLRPAALATLRNLCSQDMSAGSGCARG